MTTYTDDEYRSTKRIRQGRSRLEPPFDELAAWISKHWSVTVLNVVYDAANALHAPRLQVILEFGEDERVFYQAPFNADRAKCDAIRTRFVSAIAHHPDCGYESDGLFVVFSAFAPIAHQEADSRISQSSIDSLKRRIGNPDLWEISRFFGQVTFMFYTNAQVKEYLAKGLDDDYAHQYFAILKPHDEFDYLVEDDFTVKFDSKENFDKNYAGSWFNYYR